MSLALTNKHEILKIRAEMLRKARDFFAKRAILEVDVPLLSKTACIDLHIDLIEAKVNGKTAYLHSSPEYGMKKLLADGMGDIYQLSHVFRDKEVGERHNPEFTMVEWYRIGFSFEKMIEETLDFIHLFIDSKEKEMLSYEEAFQKYLQKSYRAFKDHLTTFAFEIEPHLGHNQLSVIYDFPENECALAKKAWNGQEMVAKRFEVFYNAMELANGYDELNCATEQERRLYEANQQRVEHKKGSYPIDKNFLDALKKGFPACCGVAVGFDRLMMQHCQVEHIDEVLPLSWR